jgi:hypothetical protein
VLYSTTVSFYLVSPEKGATSGRTEKLLLYFSQEIMGLAASDISIAKQGTGENLNSLRGALTQGSSTGLYELGINTFTANTDITVTVAKSPLNITPPSKNVTLSYPIKVTFSSVSTANTLNNSTELTLVLSQSIPSLTENDIELSVTGGIKKGTLTGPSPAGTYKLPVSDYTAGNTLTVTVKKIGYEINTTRTVTLVKLSISANSGTISPAFNVATSTYSVTSPTTATVTFTATSTPSGTITYATGASGGTFEAATPSVKLGVNANSVTFRVKTTISSVVHTFGPYTFTVPPIYTITNTSGLAYSTFSYGDYDGIIFTAGTGKIKFLESKTNSAVLIVGGGGGGGGTSMKYPAGGGGGGECSSSNALSLDNTTNYTVEVGAGGAGGANSPANGSNGGDSKFNTTTCKGGGYGAKHGSNILDAGGEGGSGGGATGNTEKVGGKHVGGYAGYKGGNGAPYGAGGGGGVGGEGVAAVQYSSTGGIGGNGGAGATNSISGSNILYAHGGNGGNNSNEFVGAGRGAGAANTGSGGQGGYNSVGYAGGSGVVILRWTR